MSRFRSRFEGRFSSPRSVGRFGAVPLTGKYGGVRPDLAILQSKGQPFFLHDFSRTDLTFQEATGQTLADDAGEAVALALDMGQIGGTLLPAYVAGRPELATGYGPFSWVGSNATHRALGVSAGSYHLWDIEITNRSAGTLFISYADNSDATVGDTVSFTSNGRRQVVTKAAATATKFQVSATSAPALDLTIHSIKEIPGYHAIQSGSTGARPTRQAGGLLRGDGADDYLLSALGAASIITLAVHCKMPATTSSAKVLIGSRTGANTQNCFLIHNASTGQLAAGIGTKSNSTLTGGADIGGQTGTAIVVSDGITDRLYWNGVEIASSATAGTITSGTALSLFALNTAGSYSLFANIDMYQAAAIQAALTPAEVATISNYWNSLP